MISVTAHNISKSYGDVKALTDTSFEVEGGELFGVIGPDGAGKTTLFRILATLLVPVTGFATVEGFDTVTEYKKIRNILGYMPGRFSLYQDLSVEENLKFYATIFGTSIDENYHLIRPIFKQLEPFRKRVAGKLSGGMKQKLALSCALIHKPKLLILDEPTTGVDAVSRMEFWEILTNLKKEGITVIVSTPYMDEATLCDRVVLMQNGSIMAIDEPQNIIAGFSEMLYAVRSDNIFRLILDLESYPKANSVYPFGQQVHLTLKDLLPNKAEVQQYLAEKGHTQIDILEIAPNIEDCFMKLMTKIQSE
jgi:ABC-type multidrug transport system ATPase subunit